MSYSKTLKAIPLIFLTLVLWAALAEGQSPKQAAPAKLTAPPVATKEATRDAGTYSVAAERKALQEIHKRAQVRVEELAESLPSLSDESDRRALQSRISGIKREARLEQLRAKAYFALGRGDLQAAHDIDQIIERILEPRFSVPVTPAEKTDPLPEKGGRP